MKLTSQLISALAVSIVAMGNPVPEPICYNNGLQVHVYHLAPEPVIYQNSTDLSFSPTSFTLVSGEKEAILIDAPATIAQGEELATWISTTVPGKELKAIYITHGHGDHFFSARSIQEIYPNVEVLATSDTAAHIAQQYEEPLYSLVWTTLFPNKLDAKPIEVTTLPADGIFHLEGHVLQAVEVGQGDTYNSTILHVPDLDLVVTGDVVYGDCHQLFAEDNTPELRALWLQSIDKVAALQPSVVIPSHQTPDTGYSSDHIAQTKEYIQYYEEMLPKAKSWQELESAMKTRFSDRDGTFILRWSSQAPFDAAF